MEPAILHQRSLWLTANGSGRAGLGRVDRLASRQWCGCVACCMLDCGDETLLEVEAGGPGTLAVDNAALRGDLEALPCSPRAMSTWRLRLPPCLTHAMRPADAGRGDPSRPSTDAPSGERPEAECIARANAMLLPIASQRRTAARDSRHIIAFAPADGQELQHSTFDAGHSFSAAGLAPLGVEKPPASHCVRPCDAGAERGGRDSPREASREAPGQGPEC